MCLYAIKVCMPAAKISHGTKDAFSTGSHAQKPPKLKASYAHAPPIKMPVPKIMSANKLQGKTGFTQSVKLRTHKDAIAKAAGMVQAANPKNKVGG